MNPVLSEKRAFLFDMDGVLFDSMPYHAKTWAEVSRLFDIPMDEAEAYLHEGRTGGETINILMRRHHHRDASPEEQRAIYAKKCELFNACPLPEPIAGAAEALEALRAAGKTLVCVTGSGQQSLLDRLFTYYGRYFDRDHLVCSRDYTHGKPHPEPYLIGLEKAGVRAEEAAVVENAPLGVRSAVAAGLFTIAVNTGPVPEQALWDEGCSLLFPSMPALAEALQA